MQTPNTSRRPGRGRLRQLRLRHGRRVIDVSDPSSPIWDGYAATPEGAEGVVVVGVCVYVAEGHTGMEILNTSHCPGLVPLYPAPRHSSGRRIP